MKEYDERFRPIDGLTRQITYAITGFLMENGVDDTASLLGTYMVAVMEMALDHQEVALEWAETQTQIAETMAARLAPSYDLPGGI